MRGKSIAWSLILTMVVMGFAFNGGVLAKKASGGTYNLKLGTNLPEGHICTQGYYKMAKAIKTVTNGQVNIIIYPGEQLGKERDEVSAVSMHTGIIDMVVPGPSALNKYLSKLTIFDAPYIFANGDAMVAFANGDKANELWDELAKVSNLRVLGTIYYGTREMTNNGYKGKTPQEMKGLKLRVPDSEMAIAYGKALGASPVAMSFGEVYMGLQQGVIDGQENPVPTIYDNAFYEVQKNLILTGHVVAAVCITIDEQLWKSMSKNMRKNIQKVVREQCKMISNSVKNQEEEIVNKLKAKGMNIIKPNVALFRKASKPIYKKYSPVWGKWYDIIQTYNK
jgi:tripartite ATP-independent transporter DctP family solute receptor